MASSLSELELLSVSACEMTSVSRDSGPSLVWCSNDGQSEMSEIALGELQTVSHLLNDVEHFGGCIMKKAIFFQERFGHKCYFEGPASVCLRVAALQHQGVAKRNASEPLWTGAGLD